MFNSFIEILSKITDPILEALSEDIIFAIFMGINVLFGLMLLLSAAGSYKKVTKSLKKAIATETPCGQDVHVMMLPRRGPSVIVALAWFVFAFGLLLCYPLLLLIPFAGLVVFSLFDIFARLIYNSKYAKAKKLLSVYQESVEEIQPESKPQPQTQPREVPPVIIPVPQQKEEITPTIIVPEETPATPEKEEEEKEEEKEKEETPVVVLPLQEKKEESKPEEVKKEAVYQPFEPKRPVTPVTDYNIERAPTYQVPRPPQNPPVVDLPKTEEKPVVTPAPAPAPAPTPAPAAAPTPPVSPVKPVPKESGEYTVDDIVERINQIKKEGATAQAMTQLIYTIQKEREKNENKNPEQRQKLSEALSELFKAMKKNH